MQNSLELFSIGEVAKMFRISVSSLRHYEEIGILSPEKVDGETGYRYYSSRQFEVLNSIRYLRALDMPLPKIAEFLQNRDINNIEEKLLEQKNAVLEKENELRRIELKITNRLKMLDDAKNSVFDKVTLVQKKACRMIYLKELLKIKSYLDMENPIRRLDAQQAEAVVFLGKVGLGISAENLKKRNFENYDGIFLILDDEDKFSGDTACFPETTCAQIRFHGSHAQSKAQYEKLMDFLAEKNLEAAGFSREITMIDWGITSDTSKFVTEICIPVK